MAYTAYYLSPDRRLAGDVDDSQIRSILESESGVLWVDFTEPDDGDRDLLLNIFGFHPLTVDAVLDQAPQTVRVEDFGRYVFINAQSVDYTLDEDVLQTADLTIFIGSNYVVTAHDVYMPSVDAIRRLVEVDGRPMMKGSVFFAYSHFQALLQAVTPALDRMSDRADAIEDRILAHPDESALTAVMTLKRSSLSLSRALVPQREILSRLGRREFDLIGEGADLYFRDLFEYLVRVQAANDVIRERADTSLATYLSAVSNRQNEIMKVLSIVATIFMPLGLIAGIFGMNFEYMPGIRVSLGLPHHMGGNLGRSRIDALDALVEAMDSWREQGLQEQKAGKIRSHGHRSSSSDQLLRPCRRPVPCGGESASNSTQPESDGAPSIPLAPSTLQPRFDNQERMYHHRLMWLLTTHSQDDLAVAQNGTDTTKKTSESLVHTFPCFDLHHVTWRSRELYNNEENATECHTMPQI